MDVIRFRPLHGPESPTRIDDVVYRAAFEVVDVEAAFHDDAATGAITQWCDTLRGRVFWDAMTIIAFEDLDDAFAFKMRWM